MTEGRNTQCLIIQVPGRPTTKQRPRFARGRAYKPRIEKEREKAFRNSAIEQLAEYGLTEPYGPEYVVKLTIYFTFPYPKSFSKKKKTAVRIQNFYTSPPDLDNLIKFVKDALNGVLYADDRQVWSYGGCTKKYGEQPGTVVIAVVERKGW